GQQGANVRGEPWTVLVAALAFPRFFHLTLWGQTCRLALLCFTVAFLALSEHRPYLAGIAIGSLIFKPQLGLAPAIIFLFAREWKVIATAILAALAQLSVGWLGWLFYGTPVTSEYLRSFRYVGDVMTRLERRP